MTHQRLRYLHPPLTETWASQQPSTPSFPNSATQMTLETFSSQSRRCRSRLQTLLTIVPFACSIDPRRTILTDGPSAVAFFWDAAHAAADRPNAELGTHGLLREW